MAGGCRLVIFPIGRPDHDEPMANPTRSRMEGSSMRRLVPILVVMFALLAFAPAVSADTTPSSPRESYESVGFDAFNSDCDARTCTDTYIYAHQETTTSGETFAYVCVDQWTYSLRTGRGSGSSGCTHAVSLTVAGDLSSASLAPTEIGLCDQRRCTDVIVSAELLGTGEASTFRGRFTDRDGTCTFTYSDSGTRQSATGTLTLDGTTIAVDGSIYSSKTTFASRCK